MCGITVSLAPHFSRLCRQTGATSVLWETSGGVPSGLLEMVFACVTALALATVCLHLSLVRSAALAVSAWLCPQGSAAQLRGGEAALPSYSDLVCA